MSDSFLKILVCGKHDSSWVGSLNEVAFLNESILKGKYNYVLAYCFGDSEKNKLFGVIIFRHKNSSNLLDDKFRELGFNKKNGRNDSYLSFFSALGDDESLAKVLIIFIRNHIDLCIYNK